MHIRMIPPRLAALLALALLSAGGAMASQHNGIGGYWLTPTEDGHGAVIHITREGDAFDGRIVALQAPRYPADADNGHAGEPKLDLNNPEPSLRDRGIEGLKIVRGLQPAGGNEWKDGTIYDPEGGDTYNLKAELANNGRTLKVRGYIGFSLFGRTQEWTRVSGPDYFENH